MQGSLPERVSPRHLPSEVVAWGANSDMRVLAARFTDRRAASALRERLPHVLRGGAPDVDIAPLGVPGQPASDDTVLAGRFHDDEAGVVAELIRDAGGEVVANVDEMWTRPRHLRRSKPWNAGFGRDRLHA